MASQSIGRKEFSAYCYGLDLPRFYPSMAGLGFAQIIPANQRISHTLQTGKEVDQYKLWPDGDREVYSSVVYLEPQLGSNVLALGYDMLSEPVRSIAMEQARDNDSAVLSGKVALSMDRMLTDPMPAAMMFVPVYLNNRPHSTLADRRKICWVGCMRLFASQNYYRSCLVIALL